MQSELHDLPRIPANTLFRARLHAQLDAPDRVVIVEGPPGSGRTTLVSDWLGRNAPPEALVGWVDIGENDGDRLTLWRRMLERLFDAGLASPAEAGRGTPLVTERGLGETIRRTLGALDLPILIAVDNTGDADDGPLVGDLFDFLAAHPQNRAIVIVHSSETLMQHLRGEGLDPLVVSGQSLLFTRDETEAALARHGLPSSVIDTVHSASSGLPLAVRVADMLIVDSGGAVDSLTFDEDLPARLSPLLQQRLAGGPLHAELLPTARLLASVGDVSPAAAQALTGAAAAEETIEVLTRMHLGRITEADDGPVFSLLPVVRRVLLHELGLSGDSGSLVALGARAAISGGAFITALRLAVDADDLDLASTIVADSLHRSSMHSRDELVEILAPIPRRRLRRYPLLAMQLAIVLNESDSERARAREYFELMVASARHYEAASDIDRLFVLSLESVALRMLGRAEQAKCSGEQTMRMLGELDPGPAVMSPAAYAAIVTQIGLAALYAGDIPTARSWWQHGLERTHGEAPRTSPAAMIAALAALDGELPRARELLRELDGVTTGGSYAAFAAIARAAIALEEFDIDGMREAIRSVPSHDVGEHWAWFHHLQALLDLVSVDVVVAATRASGRLLQSKHHPSDPLSEYMVSHSTSLLALAQGRIDEAGHAMKHSDVAAAVVHARIAHTVDATAQLLGRLDGIDDVGARLRAEAHLLDAVTHHRAGRPKAAEEFSAALELLERTGMTLPLALTPRQPLQEMLVAAVARGDERAARINLDSIPEILPQATAHRSLSERERIVLAALAEHPALADIAAALSVSPNTVKTQLRSVYRKLGVSTRDDALAAAAELGLVAPHR